MCADGVCVCVVGTGYCCTLLPLPHDWLCRCVMLFPVWKKSQPCTIFCAPPLTRPRWRPSDGSPYMRHSREEIQNCMRDFPPSSNYWIICICMASDCVIISSNTVNQALGFVLRSCLRHCLQRHFIAPESLFLTSLSEAEYKRTLQEITDALVLTENISSGDKVPLNFVCLLWECWRKPAVYYSSWLRKLSSKLSRRESVFLYLGSATVFIGPFGKKGNSIALLTKQIQWQSLLH